MTALQKLQRRAELERTHALDIAPSDRMLAITWETGSLYNIMARAASAKNILEIGTSVGFSTIWLAETGGTVTTLERNPDKIRRAAQNVQDAGLAERVRFVSGEASDTLEQALEDIGGPVDFALIDADKENCIWYFDRIFPKLRTGGVIGADNMLYPERFRPLMMRYSRHVAECQNARTVTIPVGNGQEITVKTAGAGRRTPRSGV